MKGIALILACSIGLATAPAMGAVGIDKYIKNDSFENIQLSPTGEYYAATVPMEDRTVMVVIRRADGKVTANVSGGEHSVISSFHWVSADRLIVGLAQKFGALDEPQLTGELFSVNAATGSNEMLVGQRLSGAGLGTKLQTKKTEMVAAFLVDDLPADDKNVIISVMPFSDDPFTRAELMDAKTGVRRRIVNAPVRNASFRTDNTGVIRFAFGAGSDNVQQLYYRKGDGAQWERVPSLAGIGLRQWPIGFSADNQTAYLQVEQPEGPDAIVAMNLADMSRKEVLRDDDADPYSVILSNGTNIPVGVFFMDGKPRAAFFDKQSKEAILYRSLEAAFGGGPVEITSQTSDGRLALVHVWGDRNPGDFYVFDTVAKKAEYLLSRAQWIDPAKMAEMKPIQFKARDGLQLHGYLTVPHGSSGKNLPVVVMPHGGPFGIRDDWGFFGDVQMLAEAGYAVLQVNYRGSTGYGAAFAHAGERQWGLKMQDDLTDATQWVASEGVADPGRVCIYGASYGAYAALMGAAKEPGLYKCAAGYAGVYDLPTLHTDGDISDTGSGRTYVREWIGERDALGSVSPNRMADRIKVPVFLAAGGEDERAPIKHSEMMEKALRNAGVPVETLYYRTEGHGFYLEEHRREYYTRLLAFLAKNIGGSVAATSGGTAAASGK